MCMFFLCSCCTEEAALLEKCAGWSGADIASMVGNAVTLAIRDLTKELQAQRHAQVQAQAHFHKP